MKLEIRKAASVLPKPIEWLWPGRIPKGKLTVFCGNPGVGKGLVSCDLVAAATTGRGFPDAPNDNKPMSVAMLFCEDGEADTVRPRLEAAGADLEKVFFLDSTLRPEKGDEKERLLSLDCDIKLLKQLLDKIPDIRLIVIDPVPSYMGNARMDKEQEVRQVLGPLAQLADATGVAVLLVMHFNKRADVTALHRVMGAVGMTGVARAVFLFAQDAEEENNFLFLSAKMNIARPPKGLQYTIREKQLSVGDIPFVEWRGTTEVSAEQALAVRGDESGKLTEAKKWLQNFLKRDTLAPEVLLAAEKDEISEKTLRRAKNKLHIESEKTPDGWVWLAPNEDPLEIMPSSFTLSTDTSA